MSNNKAVFDISFSAGGFDAFLKKYAEYQAALKDTPQQWQNVNEEGQQGSAITDELQLALDRHLEAMAAIDKARQKEAEDVDAAIISWEGLSLRAHSFSNDVALTTGSLIKWAGLTAVFSSILSAGGLIGIDRLAATAASLRTTSLGFANSPGQQQAFQASFGRLGDTSQLLTWINNLQEDPNQFAHLIQAAGSPQAASALANEPSAEAFADILPNLQRMAKSAPPNLLEAYSQQYGVPLALLRELRGMSPAEVQSMVASFRSEQNPLNVPPDVLQKWTDLNQTFQQAGALLRTDFENKLVLLAPGVGAFEKSVGDLIAYVLRDGGQIDKWITEAGDGLGRFADDLASGNHNSIIAQIIQGVEDFAAVLDQLERHPLRVLLSAENKAIADILWDFWATPEEAARAAPRISRVINAGASAVGKAAISALSTLHHIEALRGDYFGFGEAGNRLKSTFSAIKGAPAVPINPDTVPASKSSAQSDLGWQWYASPGGAVPLSVYGQKPKPKPVAPTVAMDQYNPSYLQSLIKPPPPRSTPASSTGTHPNTTRNTRENAKPPVVVTVPAGQTATTDYSKTYLQNLLQ